MADLKIDEKQLILTLERTAAGCLDSLQKFARDAVHEVKVVAATLETMPRNTGELLGNAVIARVYEATVRSEEKSTLTLSSYGGLQIEDPMARMGGNQENVGSLKPGRYRAVVLLLPVGSEK